MSVLRDICTCKHCGRYLDSEDQALALHIGLDSDECVDQARCIRESTAESVAVADAVADLYRLRDALMVREADYLQAQFGAEDPNADSVPNASDLFSTESLASAARW